MSPKRRDVLRAGGVAALLSGGLAGCIEDVTDAPGEEGPAYGDWLFDTSALFEASFRGFYAADVAAYRERKAALPEATTRVVQRAADEYDGIAVEDFDRVTGLGALAPRDGQTEDRFLQTIVGTGSFDADSVRTAIEANSDVSAAGSYEGYDLYRQRDRHRPSFTGAAAVSDEAVVLAIADAGGDYRSGPPGETPPSPSGTPNGGLSATAAVKLHIDAAAGEADRLLPASDRLASLAGALDGPIVGGLAVDDATLRERFGIGNPERGTGTPRPEPDGEDGDDNGDNGASETPASTPTVSEPDRSPVQRHLARTTRGLTAFGGSADASGASSGEVVFRLLYADEAAASDGAEAARDLRDALRAEVDALTVPEVSIGTDGAAVAATITGDPSAFYEELGFGSPEEPQPRAPQVSFTFDRREDGRVTVTHDGGDETGTEGTIRLLYGSDGETIERQWQPDDGSITAGDAITTDQPVTGPLRVVWSSADGGASAALGLYRPPGADEDDVPRVTFDFELGAENRITVTHSGGDVIERPLVVVYDSLGDSDRELWEPNDGTIRAGESYTTENGLAEDGSVRVLWDGSEPTVLAEYHTGATPTPRRTRTASTEDTPTRTPRERTDTATPRERTETGTATPRESTRTRTATPQETTPTRTETSTGAGNETITETRTRTPTPVEDGTPTTN